MADNVNITPGDGTAIATDDVGGAHFQRVKLVDGTLDSSIAIKATQSGELAASPLDYSLRVDFVDDNTFYKGWALPGTSESAGAWKITYTVLSGDDVTVRYADGDASFNNVWTDRLSLAYS